MSQLTRQVYLQWFLLARARPFIWGVSDCCLTAADSQVAFGRQDQAADFRGTYYTRTGAARALLVRGYKGVLDAFSDRMAPIPGHRVQFGDVVVADWGQGETAGVHDGTNGVWVQGLESLIRVPWLGGRAFRGLPIEGGA